MTMEAVFPDSFAVSQNPIFIVGFPRSGTTLLQALLTTQDNICSFPETQFFYLVVPLLRNDKSGRIVPGCMAEVFRTIERYMELEFAPRVAANITQKVEAGELDAKSLFELVIWQYVSQQAADGDAAKIRWVEKSPYHAFFLSQISAIYPEARFLHITRNPIYAVTSAKTKPFGAGQSALGLAATWNAFGAKVEEFRRNHPDKIYSLRYSDLALYTQETMAGLCGFLDIPFQADRLADYKQKSRTLILPHEYWKKDISAGEIVNGDLKYKRQVPTLELLWIQNITANRMRSYGYSLSWPGLQAIFNLALRLLHRFLGEEARAIYAEYRG